MPPSKKKSPDEIVDIKEPKYAHEALITVFKQCKGGPPKDFAELWFFAKFPDQWATDAIRRRGSGWTYERCEPVVHRVRNLYIWATPILEN
jgi:hypothetical protein